MENTENYWQHQYEMLFKQFLRQQNELKQWEAGGILWTWTDVHILASDEMGIRLSQDDCEIILSDVIENHDADQGVTWLTIRTEIENFTNR
jgi:hypothetical protein